MYIVLLIVGFNTAPFEGPPDSISVVIVHVNLKSFARNHALVMRG
jgi:hypothetical protein